LLSLLSLTSLRHLGLAAVAVSLLFTGTNVTASAATAGPSIGPARALGAPIGEKGGIENAAAYCPSSGANARARWVLMNLDTGYSHTFTMRWATPGMASPRVAVGTYTSRTTAWCGTHKAIRTETLVVKQKTARTTISMAEFRSIRRGMTTDQVRDIIGYHGRYAGRWAGKTSRVYDMMAFWRWSQIAYRDGRVAAKYWNVPHD
jgi:hypothetical protein